MILPKKACASSEECAAPAGGSAHCDYSDGPKCVVISRGKLGDECGETCTDEGTSVYCTSFGMSNQEGASCYTNDGLYCGSGGTCVRLVALGEACSDSDACVGNCDEGKCAPEPFVSEAICGGTELDEH